MNKHICKAKCPKTGKWIQGYYLLKTDPLYNITYHYIVYQQRDKNGILDSLTTWWPIDPDTLCRYTGEVDKNEVPIYENDIVKMRSYGGGIHTTEVYFKKGKFAVDDSSYGFKDLAPSTYEVVGNIFDSEMMHND